MHKPTFVSLCILLISACRAIAGDPIVLDNGARLILEPLPGTGAVSVIALYQTGYADDLAGVAQSAHLAEHLRVTAGIGDEPAGQAQAALNRAGACNAETLATITYYDYALPAGSLELALRSEAQRLTSLRITDADIAREIPRVNAEVHAVVSAPGIMLGKFACMAGAQLWLHQPDTGTIDVRLREAPDAATMAAYVARHHSPSALTLMIAGEFDPDQATELARTLIAPIANPPQAVRPKPETPDFTGLPAERKVAWDLPAVTILVALPTDSGASRAEVESVAARASFALNQRPEIASAFSSGPTVRSGPLPLLVGVCVRADADRDRILELVHEALDRAARTTAPQARSTAGMLYAPIEMPSAERINAMVAARAHPRPLMLTAQMMGNALLQSSLRGATQIGAESIEPDSDDALEDRIRAALARSNRRVLIIAPE